MFSGAAAELREENDGEEAEEDCCGTTLYGLLRFDLLLLSKLRGGGLLMKF